MIHPNAMEKPKSVNQLLYNTVTVFIHEEPSLCQPILRNRPNRCAEKKTQRYKERESNKLWLNVIER